MVLYVIALFEIFEETLYIDWLRLHPPRAAVCRPRQTRGNDTYSLGFSNNVSTFCFSLASQKHSTPSL